MCSESLSTGGPGPAERAALKDLHEGEAKRKAKAKGGAVANAQELGQMALRADLAPCIAQRIAPYMVQRSASHRASCSASRRASQPA